MFFSTQILNNKINHNVFTLIKRVIYLLGHEKATLSLLYPLSKTI
jgi:hypothetical protein